MDLAGGLLDIWPIHAIIDNCFVVNVSIPIFTCVEGIFNPAGLDADKNTENKIDIEVLSRNKEYRQIFFNIHKALDSSAEDLFLLRQVLKYFDLYYTQKNQYKKTNSRVIASQQKLSLRSESPIGGGLGASSSLCVSLVRFFSEIFDIQISPLEFVLFCRDIEAGLLNAPAGFQDYIPAFDSEIDCFYIIKCSGFHLKWRKKQIPLDLFKQHFFLIDTGKSHHSGNDNWLVLKKAIEGDKNTLTSLYRLRDNAIETVEACEREDKDGIFNCLEKEQNLRTKAFPHWEPPVVSKLVDFLKAEKAKGVKLCGAGGGGCLLVWADNFFRKNKLLDSCQKNQIPVIFNW